MKTRALALILIVSYTSFCFAQEKIIQTKRMYKSPDGKLYIQKELPLYLRISTSPDEEAPSFLLHSEETKKYTNPMYLDTEGYNTVRSPSAVDTVTKEMVYPEQDIIFEVYADSKPPVSKAEFGNYFLYKKDGKIFTRGQLKLVIKSFDIMSGIDKIYISIDGSAYKEYTNPVDLSQEKEYEIKFYAIDNVGNDEDIQTLKIVIDASKPESKIEISGDKYEDILSGRSSVLIVCQDNYGIKNTYYSLDDAPKKIYKYPIQATYLSEGEHNIKYYSVDDVENEEAEQTYTFYIDKTAPTIVQEILGNSIIANGQEYSSGRSKLKLTTFDNKAGVKDIYYSINGGEYQLYSQPFYLSAISGKLNVKAYALDNVNNKSSESQEMSKNSLPYIDLSGPSIKYKFTGPVFYTRDSIFINNKTKIILQGYDAEAGLSKITYSVDNETISEYGEPFNIEKEGMHKISFTATDNVDNTNSNDFFVFVDNTGPEIYTRFSTPAVKEENGVQIYPSYVVLFISSTDLVVGFDKMSYKMNETAEKPYDGYIIGFARSKDYTILIKSRDKLGNLTENTVSFKTDVF